jgi:hypothetical protein
MRRGIASEAKAAAESASRSTDPTYSSIRVGDTVHILHGERPVLSWSYMCLPDTVDPREPKGK